MKVDFNDMAKNNGSNNNKLISDLVKMNAKSDARFERTSRHIEQTLSEISDINTKVQLFGNELKHANRRMDKIEEIAVTKDNFAEKLMSMVKEKSSLRDWISNRQSSTTIQSIGKENQTNHIMSWSLFSRIIGVIITSGGVVIAAIWSYGKAVLSAQ